jgi:hypothetical protein
MHGWLHIHWVTIRYSPDDFDGSTLEPFKFERIPEASERYD